MSDNLTVREMMADDLERFRELYLAVWGYNRPVDYDRWRLFDTPYGICPTAVAEDAGRLAGLYTLWPAELRLGGETVLGGQSMDTMTHPDYRGRGLFTKLALACYEIAAAQGMDAVYGFPNPLSYPGFVRRLNWDHTGDVTHWVRPLKLSRHPSVPVVAGVGADAVTALMPSGPTGSFDVSTTRPPASEIRALRESQFAGGDTCRVARTEKWLDWRYSERSENDYRWITISRSGELLAVAAWGMRSDNWHEVSDGRAHLVEFIGKNKVALGCALRTAIQQARAADAVVLETLCNVPRLVEVLRKAWFFKHRQAPFIARKLTARNLAANIHVHNAWCVTGGDVDTF